MSWFWKASVTFPNGLVLDEFVIDELVVDVPVLDTLVVVDVNVTGTNSSGWTEIMPAPKCSLSAPRTASVELTSLLRKVAVWSLDANSFAEDPVTSFTNADTTPSGLTYTVLLFPCKLTTDWLPTPHATAMSLARATWTSSICAESKSSYGKFMNSTVMRTLPSGKQSLESPQVMQVSSRSEPSECTHLPCGQMVHSVFAKSLFHEPAGQEAHVAAPIIVPNFPGGQRMHTL